MKTLSISIALSGKITVPDDIVKQLRTDAQSAAANSDISKEFADQYAIDMNAKYPEDDEAFVQALLKNALRSIIRTGFAEDVNRMGCGIKLAPAQVEVSMPERIVTMVKGREQIAADNVQGVDNVATIEPFQERDEEFNSRMYR